MENISPAPTTGYTNVQNVLDSAIPASQNFDNNKTSETIGSRVEEQAIYRLMSGKKLPYYKPSKLCYFFKADLVDYLKGSRVETKKEAEERIQEAATELIKKRKGA